MFELYPRKLSNTGKQTKKRRTAFDRGEPSAALWCACGVPSSGTDGYFSYPVNEVKNAVASAIDRRSVKWKKRTFTSCAEIRRLARRFMLAADGYTIRQLAYKEGCSQSDPVESSV